MIPHTDLISLNTAPSTLVSVAWRNYLSLFL